MSPVHPLDNARPDIPMRTTADERAYVLQPNADFRHVAKHDWTAQRLQSGRGRNQAAGMIDDRGGGYFGKRC